MDDSKYAARDPAVEAALADLGFGRRDFITAFDDAGAGRNARAERMEKLKAKDEADARRAAREQGAARGDGLAVQLSAWNDASRFEADPSALHSEDIGGGQSHRARLREARESGRLRDFDEPRRGRGVGEERNNYLQSRNISGNDNYVAVGGAVSGPSGTRRTVSSVTPRAAPLISAPIPTNSSNGRTVPSRPNGVARPPSPRSQGTARFGAGGRRTERPSAARGGQPQPAAARPILQGLAAAGLAAGTRPAAASSTPPRTTPGTSASVNRPVAAATPTVPRPIVNPAVPATTTARPTVPPGLPQGAANRDALHQPEDHIQREMFQYRALYYAATPDSEAADNFARSDPRAVAYMEEARRRLINEITAIVERYDPKEMESYIKAHPERTWMVGAAVKARELLKHGSNNEIAAYYKQHETQSPFLAAAHSLNSSKTSARNATTKSGLSPPTTDGVSQQEGNSTSPSASRERLYRASAVVPATTSSIRPPPGLSAPATNVTSQQADGPTSPSVSSDHTVRASSAVSAEPSSIRPPPGLSASTANGASQQPDSSMSTFSSRSSLRSAETDVTVPPRRGTLNISLLDNNGRFLGHEQIAVDAPVNATMSLTSNSADYDPRTFVESLNSVFGGGVANNIGEVPPVANADDGVWDSDEEL